MGILIITLTTTLIGLILGVLICGIRDTIEHNRTIKKLQQERLQTEADIKRVTERIR